MAINHVELVGRLTADAEAGTTPTGMLFVNFSLAVNMRRRDRTTGTYRDEPNYFDCTIYGERSHAVAPSLQKGVKVAVAGVLMQQKWEQEVVRRSKVQVIVNDVEFMSARRDRAAEEARRMEEILDDPALGQVEPVEDIDLSATRRS